MPPILSFHEGEAVSDAVVTAVAPQLCCTVLRSQDVISVVHREPQNGYGSYIGGTIRHSKMTMATNVINRLTQGRLEDCERPWPRPAPGRSHSLSRLGVIEGVDVRHQATM